MKKRLRAGFVIACALLFLMTSDVFAQAMRSEGSIFIRPRVGLSFYLGDNEQSPFNFNGDIFDVDGKFPYGLALEVGYQFNPRYGLGLGVQFADYPVITQFLPQTNTADHPTTRTSIQLIAHYMLSQGRLAPYINAGLHATIGKSVAYSPNCAINVRCTEDTSTNSAGPLIGFGVDYFINEQLSLFAEINSNIAFPDAAADETESDDMFGNFDIGGFGPADFLNAWGVGLKINFKKAIVPVQVLSVNCPATLETGQSGSFSASTNLDATPPVSTTWSFGDGGTATGTSASHSFASAGTYTVTFNANNAGGPASGTCTVTVSDACMAAEIVTMTASSMSPDTRTAVRFSANVRGTAPVGLNWNFGDGSTSTQSSPTHTYSSPGSYTVNLSANNCGGTVSRSLTINVSPFEVPCPAELNSSFFARNSSTLSTDARARLQENLQILLDQPNVTTQIDGYAAPGERNAQRLSEDRARAVEQFYIDNGVAASRLTAVGRGRVQGATTSKKEGTSQYRRADSIPSCN